MKKRKIVLFKILFICSLVSYTQTDIITINPEEAHQQVIFGGDNKLTIKAWAEGNTNSVSSKLFKDMDLKILRVPIFALQDITDPIYDNVITVINSVKSYNPEVKIFASIANGDGYGVNHHGASKFPSGWTGCCPYNVYSLNLTTYSAYLDSFMQRMTAAGISVDYLGPYNEDPGDNSDYSKIIAQMTALGNTEIVGLERFSLQTSIDDVDDIENQATIVGSHFYDDGTIPEEDWDSTWASLVEKSEDPVWYTEATRYSTGDNIGLLIAGMDNIFAPIRGGAEAIIFYQVCKRFVYANGSKLPIKYSGFQNIVNNAAGNVIASSSNNINIKVVVFGDNDTLDVHVLNKNTSENTIDLQLLENYLGNGTVTQKVWTATATGTASTFNLTNESNWKLIAPASSYLHLKVRLNKSILNTKDVVYTDKEINIFPNPSKGDFKINLPNYKNGEEILIKIYAIDGKEVVTQNSIYQPNLALKHNLLPGIYFIKLTAKNNTIYHGKVFIK